MELQVRLLRVALDLGCLLLCLDDLSFLVHDLLVELGEEERELRHGLLDALDVVVAGADGAEDARGLAGAIGLELGLGTAVSSMAWGRAR